jgi:pyruvate dehydrogenase phosphatase
LKVDLPSALALSRLSGTIHPVYVENWTNHSPPYILSHPAVKRHRVLNTGLLVLASDGLRTAMRCSSSELGNVISQLAGKPDKPGRLASTIIDEARHISSTLPDDITILVLRVGGLE